MMSHQRWCDRDGHSEEKSPYRRSLKLTGVPGHGKGKFMMKSTLTAALLKAALALGVAAMVAGCAQKTIPPGTRLSTDGRGGPQAPAKPGSKRDFAQNVGDIVYFSTDSVDLTPEAQQTLQQQGRWLNRYAGYTITIEGHADERGTREYNIALGARRAAATRDYLVAKGVPRNRIRTISYGKERPVAVCNDISCWSQNRRAVTVLAAPSG